MILGGSDVPAALDRHQERQDTHLLAAGALECAVGRKVRQETVAQLGELDAKGRIAASHLADSIVGVDRQPGLFDAALPTDSVTVVPSRLRLERGRRFGDVWLAWKLWQALGLDAWLEKRLSRGREDVPWSLMAAVPVIARLCEPSSELHIAEDWFRRTALDDLLGLPEAKINDDRLYRALDRLLPHNDALERHLKECLGACSNWNMICCCTTSPAPTSRARRTATRWPRGAIHAIIGPTVKGADRLAATKTRSIPLLFQEIRLFS